MMKAKIITIGTTLIDAGSPHEPDKKVEGAWTVDIAVTGIDEGVTREDIMNAYRDNVEFEVTPT